MDGGTPCATDGEVCTNDQCDGTSPNCQHLANTVACDNGFFCDGSDTCAGGSCSVHAGNPCVGPDGDANCAESCNETGDTCTAADPNGSDCDDGDICTVADQCSAGACAGQPSTEDGCTPTTTLPEETTTTTLPGALCGDANEDGRVTAADALLVLKTAVGAAECSFEYCDFNGDGRVTASDALAILRLAVGQEVEPHCPEALLFPSTTIPVTSTTLTSED